MSRRGDVLDVRPARPNLEALAADLRHALDDGTAGERRDVIEAALAGMDHALRAERGADVTDEVARAMRARILGRGAAMESEMVEPVVGALAVAPQRSSGGPGSATGGAGVLAMAMMSEPDFELRLAALKKGQERIGIIKRELMTQGSHYGTIPGTDKPTLLKPGAEVLCSIYGLRADFIPRVEYGDGEIAPPVRVTVRCELHHGDLAGPVVAVGYGAASSWERKHRYRRAERSCPECGAAGQVRRSGFADNETGEKGWYCRECRAKFRKGDPAIEEQQGGEVENPDQHELENTLVKMAEKRAHIDATLRGTASSDLFTQDVEDMPGHGGHDNDAAPGAAVDGGAAPRPPAQARPQPARSQQRPTAPPPAGAQRIPCPDCGKPAGPSKWPKPGATFYCFGCKHGFEPGFVPPDREPGADEGAEVLR